MRVVSGVVVARCSRSRDEVDKIGCIDFEFFCIWRLSDKDKGTERVLGGT